MMPNVDPIVRFWIGIAVTFAIAVSGGTFEPHSCNTG